MFSHLFHSHLIAFSYYLIHFCWKSNFSFNESLLLGVYLRCNLTWNHFQVGVNRLDWMTSHFISSSRVSHLTNTGPCRDSGSTESIVCSSTSPIPIYTLTIDLRFTYLKVWMKWISWGHKRPKVFFRALPTSGSVLSVSVSG